MYPSGLESSADNRGLPGFLCITCGHFEAIPANSRQRIPGPLPLPGGWCVSRTDCPLPNRCP